MERQFDPKYNKNIFHKIKENIGKLACLSAVILIFLYLFRFFVKHTQALGYGLIASIMIDVGCFLFFVFMDLLITFVSNKLLHKERRFLGPIRDVWEDFYFSFAAGGSSETKKMRKDRTGKEGKVEEIKEDTYTNMLN